MSTTTLPRPAWPGSTALSGRLRGLVRGCAEDSAWARPALIVLLAATAIAYLINLTASGDANSFYAAAVQAATKSWKAFFFGSIDSSSFITVDKPPASLWVMALSGRLFGFSSASMLVPQVLEGVLAVGLLAAAVRRWFGAGAGLLAGALLALTPVAALMFRFNNPDALLVVLLVASAYCLVRAIEGASTRWLVAVGTLLGFAFLAKMAQAFLVLPGFALVYGVAAPATVRRRVAQLLAGGLAVVVSAGWWVAIVALWPAASRPMIDGTSDNSILNLIVGYNGLGRIFGASGPGGSGGGGGFSGATGVLRLFNDLMGGQASWLLPVALVAIVGGLWWRRRAPRTDRTRAAFLLWGSWLVVSGAVFSLGSGVIHTYYTVALAPAIAALSAMAAATLWRARGRLAARLALAAGVAVTAAWAIVLLDRTASWEPWLRPVIAVAAVVAIAGLLVRQGRGAGRAMARWTALAAAVACLAAPAAYAAQTIATAHTGSVPSAGPASASGFGGPGGGMAGVGGRQGGTTGVGGRGGGATSAALVSALERDASHYRWVAATSGSQSAASLELATGGDPVMALGGFSGNGGDLTLAQFEHYVAAGDIHFYLASGAAMGGALPTASGTGGPPGGQARGADAAGGFPGAAAGRQGSPSPLSGPGATSSGAAGGPSNGAPGGSSNRAPGGPRTQTTQAITAWVKSHYRAVTIGGQTVYDLTQPVSS